MTQHSVSFQKEFHVVRCLRVEGSGNTRLGGREGIKQAVCKARIPITGPAKEKVGGAGLPIDECWDTHNNHNSTCFPK